MGVLNIDMIANKIIEVNFRPASYLINRKIGVDFLTNYINLLNNTYNSGEYQRIIPINVNENLYTTPQNENEIVSYSLYILIFFTLSIFIILLLLK